MTRVLLKQFLVFCGVGLVNTAISAMLLVLLSELTQLHYIVVNAIGHGTALLSGFFLHKYITFRQMREGQALRHFLSFIAVFGVSYIIQLSAVAIMIEYFGIYATFAQIVGLAIMAVIAFIGNRFITFSRA